MTDLPDRFLELGYWLDSDFANINFYSHRLVRIGTESYKIPGDNQSLDRMENPLDFRSTYGWNKVEIATIHQCIQKGICVGIRLVSSQEDACRNFF